MIKKSLVIGVLSLNAIANYIDTTNYFNDKNCSEIIEKKVYTSCYSFNDKGTKALKYRVNGKLADGYSIKDRPYFYEEESLHKKYRVNPYDYSSTGYDRGHLSPDATFDFEQDTLNDTYSMINIVPQKPNLNRGVWLKAERYERMIARKLDTLDVLNLVEYSNQKIKRNSISIPSKFYKIMYNNEKNFYRCFSFDNIDYDKEEKLRTHEISCEPFLSN